MTILENLIKELTTEKNNGVESYLFAIQYTNDIVSVVEMAIAEIAKILICLLSATRMAMLNSNLKQQNK